MVPFRKVKCIRSKHLDSSKKLESDVAVREVVELGRVLHKVSPGYQFVKHMQTTNSERVDEFLRSYRSVDTPAICAVSFLG